MKEILVPYGLLCWILFKTGVLEKTPKNYTITSGIGIFLALVLFFAHTFYSPIDYTKSSVVRARSAILSSVSQSIDKYYIDHNQLVKKGDILYTLKQTDQKALVDNLNAQLDLIDAEYNQLTHDKERLDKLKKEHVAARDIEMLEFDIAHKLIQRKTVEAEMSKAHQDLQDMTVYAPFDGLVTRLDTAAGSKFGNLQIWRMDSRILEMRVPDQLWARIKKGQFSEFQVDAYPGHIFRGRVHSITGATGESQGSHLSAESSVLSQISRSSSNLGRTVIIEFDDPYGITIPIGARGTAWISADKPYAILGVLDILGAATVRLNAIKSYLGAL